MNESAEVMREERREYAEVLIVFSYLRGVDTSWFGLLLAGCCDDR